MSKQTFSWQVDAQGAQAEHKPQVRVVRLGEGYEQRQQTGLRPKLETWAVQKTGHRDSLAPILAFLDAHAGYKSFYWVPPGRPALLVKVAEWKEAPVSGDIWRLSWTFEEVLA